MYYCGMDDTTKTMIVKSGTDFKNVSWMQIQLNNDKEGIDQSEQAQSFVNICNSLQFLKTSYIKY